MKRLFFAIALIFSTSLFAENKNLSHDLKEDLEFCENYQINPMDKDGEGTCYYEIVLMNKQGEEVAVFEVAIPVTGDTNAEMESACELAVNIIVSLLNSSIE